MRVLVLNSPILNAPHFTFNSSQRPGMVGLPFSNNNRTMTLPGIYKCNSYSLINSCIKQNQLLYIFFYHLELGNITFPELPQETILEVRICCLSNFTNI